MSKEVIHVSDCELGLGLRVPPQLATLGLEGVAKWSAEIGLDGLDLGVVTPTHLEVLARYGLRLGTVDAVRIEDLLNEDAAVRSAGVKHTCAHMERMASLGARVMFASLTPADESMGRARAFALWADTSPAVLACARRVGITLAMELWPGHFPHYATVAYTPEMLRRMFALAGPGGLGICYDPSHLVRIGVDPLAFLREFGEHVVHIHGKDCSLLGNKQYEYGCFPPVDDPVHMFSGGAWRYCVLGDGQVPWRQLFSELRRMEYKGMISIELEDEQFEGSIDRECDGIALALERLDELRGS